MLHEIYSILSSDQRYKPQLETTDEITQILQQIRMILGTKPGDVLGDISFGIDISQYLFSMSYDKEQMRELITQAIINKLYYDPTKYNVVIDIKFGKDHDSHSDYAILDISINQQKVLGIMINQ